MVKKRRSAYAERILKALLKYTPDLCARCKCLIIGFTTRHEQQHPQLPATSYGEGMQVDEIMVTYETRIQELKDLSIGMALDSHKANGHAGRVEDCEFHPCKGVISKLETRTT